MEIEEFAEAVLSSQEQGTQGTRYFGPNWYASVMGTGIVANAGAILPFDVPGLKTFCLVVWLAAFALLAGLVVASAVHMFTAGTSAWDYVRDPQMSQFYGAPPMALLTVGAGAILTARGLLGLHLALDIDWTLWILGTVGGLLSATLIPFRHFTEMEVRPDSAFGGWLMPIVPPMVSATTGAMLVPFVASHSARATLFYACFALFGMSLVASIIVITMVWSRLAHYGWSNSGRVPTLWIVLGPLGQSITAVGILGSDAHLAVSSTLTPAFTAFAVLYGVPVWGFAMLWLVLAGSLTIRTARQRLPFSLTWWSFTFPVGVTVTGTIRLFSQTGLPAFRAASGIGYLALVAAWLTVAARTTRATRSGGLLVAPQVGAILPPVAKWQRIVPTRGR